MTTYCTCGHSEGWHTVPRSMTHLEVYALTVRFLPIPGAACEVCDDCTGFVMKTAMETFR